MKSAIGWQAHYRSNPYPTLAGALGCGLLLTGLLAGPRSRRSDTAQGRRRPGGAVLSERDRLLRAPVLRTPSAGHQPLRDWIAIAVAIYKVADSLYRLVPAFRYR